MKERTFDRNDIDYMQTNQRRTEDPGEMKSIRLRVARMLRSVDPDQIVWELTGIYLAHHASSRFHRDPQARQRAEAAFGALLRRAGAKIS